MNDHVVTEAQPDPAGERIKEAERQRIAKDLHDDLGSHLTAIKMALAQLSLQLPEREGNGALHEQARYADRLIDEAIDAMHGIIDDLHPAVLDLGLQAGLEWLAKTFSKQTGIPHRMLADDDLPAPLLDDFQTVSLYRIAREALHNAARHAAATNVDIRLHRDRQLLTLEISDNGGGLPDAAATQPESSGLRGMHRRAATIGATLALLPADGGGTRLQVRLPVRSGANPIE
ncbi:sensor histidine kinase [Herbaspirillum sp. RV1423]|uniref:sensor histidine kinase n=1 Tax=Herbaspirillum sp. RV1423 TaxID=1443993 RepID=UPI0004AC926D|nr:sensor histidine kinase [Herbaspirillum sp. RV1423]